MLVLQEGVPDPPSVSSINRLLRGSDRRDDDGRKDYSIHGILGGKFCFLLSTFLQLVVINKMYHSLKMSNKPSLLNLKCLYYSDWIPFNRTVISIYVSLKWKFNWINNYAVCLYIDKNEEKKSRNTKKALNKCVGVSHLRFFCIRLNFWSGIESMCKKSQKFDFG